MVDPRASVQNIGRRYVLQEKLGQGGMGTVYRAYDRLTSQTVALKHVTLQKENLQFATRITGMDVEFALAQEFKTLASLRHPYIISVLDYGFDDNLQPFFTMELLEGAQEIITAGSLCTQDEQIAMLVQVLQALAYLHRHGIIHRDLKPDNVVVMNGQVKVLDFGLAVAQEYLKSSEEIVAGTLGYMAPEVLQGEPASIASDLYAVGVMAYELFAEKYPYEVTDVTQLINDIMFTEPDIGELGLGPVLENVLKRLLAKNPADRFANAHELITLYSEVTSQQIKYDSIDIRESYLQAARFVGREEELALLMGALQDARDGRGSTWLIGGESGVGKSRLTDELRTQALVLGTLSLHGGAISNGGKPFQVWQEPLRRLVLETDLTDTEAAILKPLIPDISKLLERPVGDPVKIEPQAAQDRLFTTVETILRRQTQPVAIFLEDLHWAGSESILMLDRLSQLSDSPVLIVANYRDDEVSNIASELPHAQKLKLNRLAPSSIQRLSESMLGEVGSQPEVVELLQRETEGNVFFIVEVVRTLAEEAGELEMIGTVSLPETVLAGGIQNLIQRRLQRIPENAYPLLQYAAVIGRNIDIRLLKQVDSTTDETTWLAVCAAAAVLEVKDDMWRFTHDKFREALIRDMPDEGRRNHHRQIAEAIETVYQDDLPAYYPILAHHWSEADITDKAVYYLEKAGEQALRSFANKEALQYFDKALQTVSQTGYEISRYRRAQWERQIGHAYWGLGNLEALCEHVEQALKLHRRPMPDSANALSISILKQVGIQSKHRIYATGAAHDDQEKLLEIVRAYKLLGQAYFFQNRANPTVYVTLEQLNLAERIPPSAELAEAYANMCLVTGLIPIHKLARTYEKRGLEVAQTLNDSHTVGQVASVVSLYYLGIGQWETALQHINLSATVADQTGDRRLWESVTGVLALVHGFEGRFQQARDVFRSVYVSSQRSGNTQTYLWGMLGQAENLLPAGLHDEARAFLDETSVVPLHKFGRDSEIRTNALNSLIDYRTGRYTQALETAKTTLQLMQESPPTSSWLLPHYGAIAEIFFSLYEFEQNQFKDDLGDLQQSMQQITKVIKQFARSFPIGQPRYGLYEGWTAWIDGKTQKAHTLWQKSLQTAKQLGMPYDEAILKFEMGRHNSGAARQTQLHEALEQFTKLEADYNVTEVRKILS